MDLNTQVVTIYAVSSGEYSDYSVQCLFTSKELATQYIKQIAQNQYNAVCNPPYLSNWRKSSNMYKNNPKFGDAAGRLRSSIHRAIGEARKARAQGFDAWFEENKNNIGYYTRIEEFQLWSVVPVVEE